MGSSGNSTIKIHNDCLCFIFFKLIFLSLQAKQQKRAAEAKNATPAQTAAEATRQMLEKKVCC